MTGDPKEADGITLGKDRAQWFRDEPSWPEVVEEVFYWGEQGQSDERNDCPLSGCFGPFLFDEKGRFKIPIPQTSIKTGNPLALLI